MTGLVWLRLPQQADLSTGYHVEENILLVPIVEAIPKEILIL